LKNEAFKSHLEAYISQLFGKEDIHSMDKKTIIGIDYARLNLKTQSLLRSAIANLPTDIQSCILEVRLCLSLLTYGTNISKNLLQLLFLI